MVTKKSHVDNNDDDNNGNIQVIQRARSHHFFSPNFACKL